MLESVRCPGCDAQLELPALAAEQTVQCPRCQRVFPSAQTPGPPPILPRNRRDDPLEYLDDDLPADLRRLARPDPMRGQWKTVVAMIFLAVSVFTFGLQTYVGYERILHIQDLRNLRHRPFDEPRVDAMEFRRLARTADVCQQVAYWPAALFFLIWIHQASANLKLLRSVGASHTPGLAAVSFLIPIVNLYRPYVIMQEIWRGSDPRATGNSLAWLDAPQSRAVGFWWFAYLAAIFLAFIAGWFDGSQDLATLENVAWLWCLSHLGAIAAGVLLIVIIYQVAARQAERYDCLYAE